MASAAGLGGSGGGTSTAVAVAALTGGWGSRVVWPSRVTAPASISAFNRDRDNSAIERASTRSSRSPASGSATMNVFCVTLTAMAQISGNNVSGNPPNADADALLARARLMMIISALTTLIAIAAVVSVIGYRMFNSGGGAISADGIITLP